MCSCDVASHWLYLHLQLAIGALLSHPSHLLRLAYLWSGIAFNHFRAVNVSGQRHVENRSALFVVLFLFYRTKANGWGARHERIPKGIVLLRRMDERADPLKIGKSSALERPVIGLGF